MKGAPTLWSVALGLSLLGGLTPATSADERECPPCRPPWPHGWLTAIGRLPAGGNAADFAVRKRTGGGWVDVKVDPALLRSAEGVPVDHLDPGLYRLTGKDMLLNVYIDDCPKPRKPTGSCHEGLPRGIEAAGTLISLDIPQGLRQGPLEVTLHRLGDDGGWSAQSCVAHTWKAPGKATLAAPDDPGIYRLVVRSGDKRASSVFEVQPRR